MQIDKAEMLRAADAKPCPTRNCGLAAAVRHGLHPHEVLDITIAHRFGVEYQPLLDAHSGELVGFEALGRFYRADGSAVPPNLMFEALHDNPLLLLHVELEMGSRLKRTWPSPGPPASTGCRDSCSVTASCFGGRVTTKQATARGLLRLGSQPRHV